jgi:hypothetical protein
MRIFLTFPYSSKIFDLFSNKFLLNTYAINNSYILIYTSIKNNKTNKKLLKNIIWSNSNVQPDSTLEDAQEIAAMFDLTSAFENPDLFCEWFEERFGEML